MEVPSCSSKQVIRAAIRLGFIIKSGGKGSHTKLEHYSGKVLIVPETKDIGKGLRKRLITDLSQMSNRTVDDVIGLLSMGLVFAVIGRFMQFFR